MSEYNPNHQNAADIPRVSLKQTLEKLFGDEQFNRAEHIQYIADLLTSHPNDQYLKELNLDLLDFDLQTNSVVARPAALVSSRKHTVSATPVTWYVNSIAQLAKSEENALTWNILVLKAAIYLIALPELKPDLFKQAHAEHFNTVKRLFQRFRTANKNLDTEKKYHNTEEYKRLWNVYLKDLTLSLEQFIQHLITLDTDELPEFDRNLLNDIRITFNYVLKNKAKIARASIDTQLQHQFLDEEQFIEESIEIKKGAKSKALNIETSIDEPINRQIVVNPTDVTPLAAHSETSQSYVLPLVAKHIQRKEHLLTSSSFFPNPSSVNHLLKRLHVDYSEHQNKSALILMLAFLTGNSVNEWLYIQSKRAKNLNNRQKLIHKNDQFFLSSKFNVFENRDFEYSNSLLNQTIYLDIPIPNLFIEDLRKMDSVSFDDIQQYLRKLRQELLIPKLSVVKVSSLLHYTVLAKTGNKQLADLITGIDANQSSSVSYCHQNIPRLHAQYVDILKSLCADVSNTYESCVPSLPDSIIHFGSRKAPKPQVITEIFAVLKFNIFSQAEDDLIAIYNHYNIWMWHILLLFTAARPVAEFPGFLKNFNLKRQILMVSDKEVGGRNGFGRLIPLCSFLVEEIKKFLKFLEYFSTQIMMSHPALNGVIQQIEASKLPFLGIIQDDEWKPLSPSTVKNFHPELGLDHANWHRHTARAFLTHKITEPEILALFGHELMQQEAAHPFSSLSLSQFSKIANVLEQMKDQFKISGIEVHVIIQ
ncbi:MULTISPECIES: hypothetical protein [Acinetobacter calcoaceticus/baumannii complex]|uniref:Uncharacterized protein n=2 Tax=Acinetobacter calcoaceticus/baumannii complex TaxID=909768 RepID=A0A7H2ZPW7_9GAMM|nr:MULTISPECIES: hypothetical protein [Acinetobacter calcoaceticus/baumannii complex]EJB8375490.1 hypothetical protein [Acinetobacter baumannii]ELA7466074.1 hypothetical protein [Acinetobacter nosocomialis]MBJ9961648.1 hypothetical protein [Acinetobacter nosocomialis]MDH2551748.1 hypothetical protein [Acinetobacter baumannii]PZL99157.1 hypothetical protein DOL92_14605 [Acinetobacter nosocomialis]